MRKPKKHIKSWHSYPKSVSFKIQTLEAIERLMSKTGKTFSQIVEDCCHQIIFKDVTYFRMLARDAAMDVAKWQHMEQVAITRKNHGAV